MSALTQPGDEQYLNPCTAAQSQRFARALRSLLEALDGEIVVAALVRDRKTDLLDAERQEVHSVRKFLDDRIGMRSQPSHLRSRGLAVLDTFADQIESRTELHESSPSLDARSGAGDTASVGDGPAPGDPGGPGHPNKAVASSRDCGLPGLPVGLTEALIKLPKSVDYLQQRGGLRLSDGLDVEQTNTGGVGHEIDELPAAGHGGCDFESTDIGSPVGVFTAHNKSPYVARALTRYVAGAVLMPLRWLQRKAVTRRAVPPARPSGTTKPDGP